MLIRTWPGVRHMVVVGVRSVHCGLAGAVGAPTSAAATMLPNAAVSQQDRLVKRLMRHRAVSADADLDVTPRQVVNGVVSGSR